MRAATGKRLNILSERALYEQLLSPLEQQLTAAPTALAFTSTLSNTPSPALACLQRSAILSSRRKTNR